MYSRTSKGFTFYGTVWEGELPMNTKPWTSLWLDRGAVLHKGLNRRRPHNRLRVGCVYNNGLCLSSEFAVVMSVAILQDMRWTIKAFSFFR